MSVPHIPWPFVNVVRDDGSVMSPWPVCRPLTWLRTEPRLTHQPQNPHFRGADALVTYPSGQAAFLRSWGFQFHGMSSSMGLICDQQRVPAPM